MKPRYRNVAFLAELIINILVFSVACAVLVGLFGKASQLSAQSSRQAAAAGQVATLVETTKARGASACLGAMPQADGSHRFYYDEDWHPTDEAASFEIQLWAETEETPAGSLTYLRATAQTADGQLLYEMDTAYYQPGEGGPAA